MINTGRHTFPPLTEPVTVFLIGMRANRFWNAPGLGWTFRQMPKMLRELSADPQSGLLGHHLWFGRTTIMLSYWKSLEHLIGYAGDPASSHRPAWTGFNRLAGDGVGIWHETYQLHPGQQEGIYVNMPPFGLGAALGVQPVDRTSASARRRLGRTG